jgi:hypothetical protein
LDSLQTAFPEERNIPSQEGKVDLLRMRRGLDGSGSGELEKRARRGFFLPGKGLFPHTGVSLASLPLWPHD